MPLIRVSDSTSEDLRRLGAKSFDKAVRQLLDSQSRKTPNVVDYDLIKSLIKEGVEDALERFPR